MTQRNLIAGTWREGDAWISVTHPFTGEELDRVAVATTDQVDEAIAAASASCASSGSRASAQRQSASQG